MVEGCGTVGHDTECMCDVAVVDPVPIKFGLTEVWHADLINQALGLGVPWTGADAADLAEALVYAYDLWRQEGTSLGRAFLADQAKSLLASGMSMVDVADELDADSVTVVKALTNDKFSHTWEWGELEWLAAEAVIHDEFHRCSLRQAQQLLQAATGSTFSMNVVETLSEWYQVKVNTSGAERSAMMRRLLIDGMDARDVMVELQSAGHEATFDSVDGLRRRLRKRGEIVEHPPILASAM